MFSKEKEVVAPLVTSHGEGENAIFSAKHRYHRNRQDLIASMTFCHDISIGALP